MQNLYHRRSGNFIWSFKLLDSRYLLLYLKINGGDLMNEKQTAGLSSISLSRPVFIQSCASVVGKKEGEGPLGNLFDLVCEEPMFGSGTW